MSDNNRSKRLGKKNRTKYYYILFFFIFFILMLTSNSRPVKGLCGWGSESPEFVSKDTVGDVAPQKVLQITLGVYGNGIDGNVTIYTYSMVANVSPTELMKIVGEYDIVLYQFNIFFNYTSDVNYFENEIQFLLYSHYCGKIVDSLKYNAVYDNRDKDSGDGDTIVNVNNSLVFGFEEATILKLIAFGLVGSIGSVLIVQFWRSRGLIELERDEERKKKLRKVAKMNLFAGCSLFLTLFTQYVTANIFYPYPVGFDWMWGNEIYGLLLAGIVLFTGLTLYKKGFILISILFGGLLFSILNLFNFYYLLFSAIICLAVAVCFKFGDSMINIFKEMFKKETGTSLRDHEGIVFKRVFTSKVKKGE